MAYDELDHVLRPGQEPFVGPITWLMAAAGLASGVFVGLPIAALLAGNGALGFVLGGIIGLALATPVRGVLLAVRLALLARCLQRQSVVLDLGVVNNDERPTPQIRTVKQGETITIIHRRHP
jgi:hypothetical protein